MNPVELTPPHCDQAILHAPADYNEVGALLSQDGQAWVLCIHPIGEAPWLLANPPTSRVGRAPTVMSRFAIPLTQRAWNVLLSKATTIESNAYGPTRLRAHVGGVDLPIVRGAVLPVELLGGARTRPPRSGEQNLQQLSVPELPNAAGTCEGSESDHAQTAELVFHGSSWTLTTRTAWSKVPRESLLLSGEGIWGGSSPNWLRSIWSVLTVIASELTPVLWQQENERLKHGECGYCDAHPEWQALRQLWGICFTGHQPILTSGYEQIACPSDIRRPGGVASRWHGNVASPSTGCTERGVLFEEQGELFFGCPVCDYQKLMGPYVSIADLAQAERDHHAQH